MKRMRIETRNLSLGSRFPPQLKVTEYISTHKGDGERGPLARINAAEAKIRLLEDGELVWVAGPRRNELAVLQVDETIARGHVALRDVAGVAVSESVTVSKPDTDTPIGMRHFG